MAVLTGQHTIVCQNLTEYNNLISDLNVKGYTVASGSLQTRIENIETLTVTIEYPEYEYNW